MPRLLDALIIGAGAAGLAAAAEFARAGRPALVLEARDRIGGRCWTLNEPGLPVPVELGAEFIHGRPAATFSLLRKAGIAAEERSGDGWYTEGGKLEPTGEIFAEIRAAVKKTGVPRKDVSFETFLERDLRHLSARARAFARRRVEGYDAADPARASARAILEEWAGEGDAAAAINYRPAGGYGALMAALARELVAGPVELRLETVVKAVRWKRGTVEVEGTARGKSFREKARRAIITLPLGVLQLPSRAAGAVRFTPALVEKRAALRGLAPSPVVRVALQFRTAFWERIDEGRYANAVFFRALHAAFPSFWTAVPARAPLLIAWAGGPNAMRLANAAKPEIIREALASLESLFGAKAGAGAQFQTAWTHDWQRDPYARGAYSYVTVGGYGARKALARPLQDTLFFAGEAADFEGEHGTVAGALQSGVRAARQVLKE
jgi:monoamine oxidase